jgi:hypothetical protein
MSTGTRLGSAILIVALVGCMRTTRFPASEIPKLRPMMQGEPPGTYSVMLEGDYRARVRPDTDMDLVIEHEGRLIHSPVTPSRMAWRTDGLWVDSTYLPLHEIRGLEMSTFSLGRTLAFTLACAGGALLTLLLTVALLRAGDDEAPEAM